MSKSEFDQSITDFCINYLYVKDHYYHINNKVLKNKKSETLSTVPKSRFLSINFSVFFYVVFSTCFFQWILSPLAFGTQPRKPPASDPSSSADVIFPDIISKNQITYASRYGPRSYDSTSDSWVQEEGESSQRVGGMYTGDLPMLPHHGPTAYQNFSETSSGVGTRAPRRVSSSLENLSKPPSRALIALKRRKASVVKITEPVWGKLFFRKKIKEREANLNENSWAIMNSIDGSAVSVSNQDLVAANPDLVVANQELKQPNAPNTSSLPQSSVISRSSAPSTIISPQSSGPPKLVLGSSFRFPKTDQFVEYEFEDRSIWVRFEENRVHVDATGRVETYNKANSFVKKVFQYFNEQGYGQTNLIASEADHAMGSENYRTLDGNYNKGITLRVTPATNNRTDGNKSYYNPIDYEEALKRGMDVPGIMAQEFRDSIAYSVKGHTNEGLAPDYIGRITAGAHEASLILEGEVFTLLMDNGKITKGTSLTLLHGRRITRGISYDCVNIERANGLVLKPGAINDCCERFRKQIHFIDGALKIHRGSARQSTRLKCLRRIVMAKYFSAWEMYFVETEHKYTEAGAKARFQRYQKRIEALEKQTYPVKNFIDLPDLQKICNELDLWRCNGNMGALTKYVDQSYRFLE